MMPTCMKHGKRGFAIAARAATRRHNPPKRGFATAAGNAAGKRHPAKRGFAIAAGANAKRGFAMTTEAMFAMLLVALAASTLFLFNFQKHDSAAFYLCSDAAIVLSKSGAFSPLGNLQGKASEISGLTGMCIRVKNSGWGADTFECNNKQEGDEKFSFEIPAWNGLAVEKAAVSCSRPR